jgi:hypothetical protein
MKKIALLLAFLLVAGSASLFAQMMVGTEFEISGKGTVTFGYDLDSGFSGFQNAFASDITVNLVAKDSSDNDSGVGSGWRGVVNLANFAVVIGADQPGVIDPLLVDAAGKAVGGLDIVVTNPAVTATITNDVITVQVFNHPTNAPSKIANIEDDTKAKFAAEDDEADVAPNFAEDGGFSVKYHTDPVDITLGVTTNTDWTAANTGWALSGAAKATFDPVTVDVAFAQTFPIDLTATTFAEAGSTGVGSLLSATFGPATVSAGLDVLLETDANPDTTESAVDVGAGVDLAVVDGVDIGADLIYGTSATDDGDSGTTATSSMDVELEVALGLVDGLDVTFLLGLYDLAAAASVGSTAATKADLTTATDPTNDGVQDTRIAADISYAMDALGGTATLAAGLDISEVNANVLADGGSSTIGMDLSVTLAGIIANTEMGLSYANLALTETSVGAADEDGGLVKLWTTVSY